MQATITTNYCSTSPSPTPHLTLIHETTQPDGTYQGELKENLKSGLGIFIWQNGDIYFGQWSENKMQGKGVFCYNTGHYIEGNFSANVVNGPACLTFPDGSFIKGVFTNGALSGRVIFYQAENNAWFLQTYEAGKLSGVHYEGSGKPMTYDFCVNIYEEDVQGFSTRSVDNNYGIQSVQKDSVPIDNLGCFEIDSETRHFGVIKSNRIAGLGLRINPKFIEAGKYRDGQLEGFGRRLEFGKSLYEGEFIQGKAYGQGALYQWKTKTLTVGIFTLDMLMQKLHEKSFSLVELDSPKAHFHSGHPEVVKFPIRTYVDSFAKNYTETIHQKHALSPVTTTIKEVQYARVIARETIIEQTEGQSHGPRRNRLQEELQKHDEYINQQLKEDPNFLQPHKRSRSSESRLDTPFSPLFSIGVTPDEPDTHHRSKSSTPTHFSHNHNRFEIQTSNNDTRFNLFNNFSSNPVAHRLSSGVGSPGAIPTFGKGESEVNYPSVGDLSPQLFSSLESIKGISPGSPVNPFTINHNHSNYILNSPPSGIEKTHTRFNSALGLSSPTSSVYKAVEKGIHTVNKPYQAKKLNKDRNASKSTAGLNSQPSSALLSTQQSPQYRIDGSSTSRDRATPTSVFSHKHTLSSIQFPGDGQSRGWETMRSPSSIGLNSSTPTKKRKAGESPNSTSSRGAGLMSQLMKKGSGSTSTSSMGFAKKNASNVVKEKFSSPDGQLVYVGSVTYAKKSVGSINRNEITRSKGKDSSPFARNMNNFIQGKRDIKGVTNREHESLMTKSPRLRKLLQVQSPTYASDLSLQSYSISEKIQNEKKDLAKLGLSKAIVSDRSPLSARNAVLNANLSPRIAPFGAETSLSVKQTGSKTNRENNEDKLSARSKSPLIANVNLDLSASRAKTPGTISDFDCGKTGVGMHHITRDQSPFSSSYRKSESPFADSDYLTKGLETQTAAKFSFINENESPYSSITYKETNRSTFKPDELIQGIIAYKEIPREGKRTPTLSVDLSAKAIVNIDRSEEGTQNLTERQLRDPATIPTKEKTLHKRAGSQVVLSDLDRERHVTVVKTPKFSLANSKMITTEASKKPQCETPKSSTRYNSFTADFKPTENPIVLANDKLTVNTPVSSSSDRGRTDSPYKIDTQQERRNSRDRSPQKETLTRMQSSGCRHSHVDNDSPKGCYPVKKTCDPRLDSYYQETRQSGQKGSPQRGSSPLTLRSSPQLPSSPVKKEIRAKETEGSNSDVKGPRSARKYEYTPDKDSENRISITDIFRRSLTMVQSRGENGGDDVNFDLKALPTVLSRYENCTDSRSFQAFPTMKSSPERQSLNLNRAIFMSHSNKKGQIMSPQREKETVEVKEGGLEGDTEDNLTERLRSCLAQTKANIAMIEKMDRERGDEYREPEIVPGFKRQNSSSVITVSNLLGSSANGVQRDTINDIRSVESNKDIIGKNNVKSSVNKGMVSARSSVTGPWALIRDSQSLVNKEEPFTFRDQKEGEINGLSMIQKVNACENTGKEHKRSMSLSKRQRGMQVASITLCKEDLIETSDMSRDKNVGSEMKRRK